MKVLKNTTVGGGYMGNRIRASDYFKFLKDVKERIRAAQYEALKKGSSKVYWSPPAIAVLVTVRLSPLH